jgi:hypothetical protein
VNGRAVAGSTSAKGFFPVTREWKDGDVVSIDFPIPPRVTHAYHNSAVFERGPLVFALPLEGKWSELKHYSQKSGDWEVKPFRPWNYALEVGNCDAIAEEHPVTDVPFDFSRPAVSLKVRGRRLPEWTEVENSAGPVPLSPVASKSSTESLVLVPYGAAKIRVTAFPFLNQPSHCSSGTL